MPLEDPPVRVVECDVEQRIGQRDADDRLAQRIGRLGFDSEEVAVARHMEAQGIHAGPVRLRGAAVRDDPWRRARLTQEKPRARLEGVIYLELIGSRRGVHTVNRQLVEIQRAADVQLVTARGKQANAAASTPSR